jgi:anti-anti-sigma factor
VSGQSSTAGFGIEAVAGQDEYLIRLTGALDAAGCEDVIAAIWLGESSQAQRMTIDIDRLEFIDSTGLRLLLAANRRADLSRRDLRFTRGQGYVADMFSYTALDQTLRFVDADGDGKVTPQPPG